MIYKVLWIDDESNEDFITEAESYGLYIEQKNNYIDGIAWLKTHHGECSAVILDVNCKETDSPNEASSMEVFTDYHSDVVSICTSEKIPWFVYTAGSPDENEKGKFHDFLNGTISSKLWWLKGINKKYFDKPSDRILLCNLIAKSASEKLNFIIENEYKDILDSFPQFKDLIISLIKHGICLDESRNAMLLNESRKLLEGTRDYLKSHGILPEYKKELNSSAWYLGAISKNKDKGYKIVPGYVSFCFSMCVDAVQNGSHKSGEGSNLIVDELVRSGNEPYLIKGLVYGLLNILSWMRQLPTNEDEIEILSYKISDLNIDDKKKP